MQKSSIPEGSFIWELSPYNTILKLNRISTGEKKTKTWFSDEGYRLWLLSRLSRVCNHKQCPGREHAGVLDYYHHSHIPALESNDAEGLKSRRAHKTTSPRPSEVVSTTWNEKSLKTDGATRYRRKSGGFPILSYMRATLGESTKNLI